MGVRRQYVEAVDALLDGLSLLRRAGPHDVEVHALLLEHPPLPCRRLARGDDLNCPEGESLGKPATEQVIKSALALPWPAELSSGHRRIHGYAHSPAGSISRVEWSSDCGGAWNDAELAGRQPELSWARFEFAWDAAPGEHTITTRATDVAVNTQPDRIPFNEKGYLFNQPLPHPIRVT